MKTVKREDGALGQTTARMEASALPVHFECTHSVPQCFPDRFFAESVNGSIQWAQW